MALTIGETTEHLQNALRTYIEAAYHVGDPILIEQRRALLDRAGVIAQRPFIESTPKYRSTKSFADLGLDDDVLAFLQTLTHKDGVNGPLFYDPPYEHQAESLKGALVDKKSLLVMTGTGSGKTECFLLPVLGKLAEEACHRPTSFQQPAMRALVLYPMNALVNDQLARLRLMFGDSRVVEQFTNWSGRPLRFARYTSRTLYPGVRDKKKDGTRLKSVESFYLQQLEMASGDSSPEQQRAEQLVRTLQERGKWPAKPDLRQWYGRPGDHWQDKEGNFIRAVRQERDSELLTRHEVQAEPADILVTNYSMLEYMMMRPLERPIFDATRKWLDDNPGERFLLVVDEAHMYRGAAGAEVSLLLRRLRKRLNISEERLQVICTSASFDNKNYAIDFAAELTGKQRSQFAAPIQGSLALRSPAKVGNPADMNVLASVDLDGFYSAESEESRIKLIHPFLRYRDIDAGGEPVGRLLFQALKDFEPMNELVNRTMKHACPVEELGAKLFPGQDEPKADQAVTVLAALGSLARPDPQQPGLLPCRVHAFFRGLPGLWVCMDSDCDSLPSEHRGQSPTGTLYSQPRDRCSCGSQVLELFTCRNCGAAYARAYTNDLLDPEFLWSEPGAAVRTSGGFTEEFEPLDLLLEAPMVPETTNLVLYDLVTGQINPANPGRRLRDVYLSSTRSDPADKTGTRPGQFRPCAMCESQAGYGRSSVQDHQTKGDQPFQALITEQIHVQPPSAPSSEFAPLQGRKVLVFSDSRQTAARLAPNLQMYSMKDVMRPLMVTGYTLLSASSRLGPRLSLESLYFSVLLAASKMGVRLRPALRASEPFSEMVEVRKAVAEGVLDNDDALADLSLDILESADPPHALLRAMVETLTDRFYGLEGLALASICEAPRLSEQLISLPTIPVYAETEAQKLALARVWLRCWRATGFHLRAMPPNWYKDVYGTHSGKFAPMKRFLAETATRRAFEKTWLPDLLNLFTQLISGSQHQLRGNKLSLLLSGEWAYCQRCRETQRPYPCLQKCVNCGADTVEVIDPDDDPVFQARKGYYRASTLAALDDNQQNPMALIAAEHTAQLNAAQSEEVFSKAEEYELLFQDIDLGARDSKIDRTAIDILSCTTTMEVGIDIGALSGVALRNMPPARANYQQRAGRAGRRGTAVATVTAFGSADSHDEHYFRHPDQMIRGKVADPKLNVDNSDIAQRHVTAFLLQRYHTDRLPNISPEEQPQLFAVLGTVQGFRNADSKLNINDFRQWLSDNEDALREELSDWLPMQLGEGARKKILGGFVEYTGTVVAEAIASDSDHKDAKKAKSGEDDDVTEIADEEDEEKPVTDPGSEKLLDRLLFKGILPRYAFPTDVATFHVFNDVESTRFRPVFQYAPSQGLTTALSQYAPGKQVWIDGKLWTSGAVYSVMPQDRRQAWESRTFYLECSVCHYSKTIRTADSEKGEEMACPACGTSDSLGPARYWMRPPGFAHPIEIEEGTSPDDQPAQSYATRAKLTAPITSGDSRWQRFNDRVQSLYLRDHLLITNRGPKTEGYDYCVKCGRIEPAVGESTLRQPHSKPFPSEKDQGCPGGATATGMVLGTEFITDVLLLSIASPEPLSLRPGVLSTEIALRTVAEALTTSACDLLQLEHNELQAEYRPALSENGQLGREAEIYLYDTLPGGAGFARRVEGLGDDLFASALANLTGCPEGCDRSCYRCLRSYRNKFEHDLLDRHLGSTLLHHMLNGGEPVFNEERHRTITDRLYDDITQHLREGTTIQKNVMISVPDIGDVDVPILVRKSTGAESVIAIHNGLTPNFLPTAELRELAEYSLVPVLPIDETLVTRHLAKATRKVFDFVDGS